MDEQKMADGLVFISASAKTLEGTDEDFKDIIDNMVTSAGLNTTDDKDRALWIVTVTGKARERESNKTDDGYYFAYVDIVLDIKNTVTGEKVHAGTLVVPDSKSKGIKGGSVVSFDRAVEAAYKNAEPLIKEQIIKISNQ